jgi:hypothetical protein
MLHLWPRNLQQFPSRDCCNFGAPVAAIPRPTARIQACSMPPTEAGNWSLHFLFSQFIAHIPVVFAAWGGDYVARYG